MKRADQIVAELFPELTRSKVQSLIRRQKISIKFKLKGWKVLSKVGQKLEGDDWSRDDFKIAADDELEYVSRGALKLKAAIETFSIEVSEKNCLDVGLSTGGFSDFLLQNGVKKILGVDVGRGQLHPKLQNNPRLLTFDKVNARDPLDPAILDSFFDHSKPEFDLIVIDVSFISLSLIVPTVVNYLATNGVIVALIKPQFELTKKDLNKKGVVKDPLMVDLVLEKIGGVFEQSGLNLKGCCPSPIEGENGNQEVLMVAHKVMFTDQSTGELSDPKLKDSSQES